MSREAIAAAVSAADAHGDKYHVEPCPRCKQAVKLPLDQLRRSLPPGWTPAAEAAAPSAEEPAAPSAPVAEAAETSTPPAPKEKPRHHHRAGHKPE